MKKIPLTQGKFAIVDDEDYGELSKHKWYCHKRGVKKLPYAARTSYENGLKRSVHMHRVVGKIPEGMQTDHINMNTLDNRKSNLRPCTNGQNQLNRKSREKKSRFKGVYVNQWLRGENKWYAAITKDGKMIRLGSFKDEVSAARSWNNAAKKYHGEFANLNPT